MDLTRCLVDSSIVHVRTPHVAADLLSHLSQTDPSSKLDAVRFDTHPVVGAPRLMAFTVCYGGSTFDCARKDTVWFIGDDIGTPSINDPTTWTISRRAALNSSTLWQGCLGEVRTFPLETPVDLVCTFIDTNTRETLSSNMVIEAVHRAGWTACWPGVGESINAFASRVLDRSLITHESVATTIFDIAGLKQAFDCMIA
jgi:hypothetical protein